MEPQWKISAEGVGKEAKFEFPGKEGIEAQWFLGEGLFFARKEKGF